MNNVNKNIRIWKLVAIALAFSTIITTATTFHYYQELSSLQQEYSSLREECEGKTIHVSLTIDYQNGTTETFENIELLTNASVLKALMEVAKVEATWWPSFNAYFVDSINGVVNNAENNRRFWEYWVNDEIGLVSADQYLLQDGDQITWNYQQW